MRANSEDKKSATNSQEFAADIPDQSSLAKMYRGDKEE